MFACARSHRVAAVSLLLGCALAVGLTACNGKKSSGSSSASAKTTAVVNQTCPISGGAFDPSKVPVALTREFKGQKIGFCCSDCPPKWDNLTDEQKAAKLATAKKPKTSGTPKM